MVKMEICNGGSSLNINQKWVRCEGGHTTRSLELSMSHIPLWQRIGRRLPTHSLWPWCSHLFVWQPDSSFPLTLPWPSNSACLRFLIALTSCLLTQYYTTSWFLCLHLSLVNLKLTSWWPPGFLGFKILL